MPEWLKRHHLSGADRLRSRWYRYRLICRPPLICFTAGGDQPGYSQLRLRKQVCQERPRLRGLLAGTCGPKYAAMSRGKVWLSGIALARPGACSLAGLALARDQQGTLSAAVSSHRPCLDLMLL